MLLAVVYYTHVTHVSEVILVRFAIRPIVGTDVLSGAQAGRQLLALLMREIPDADVPTVVYLDFLGITVATASFLRESVLEYRRIIRGRDSHLYPVIANAGLAITDDLELLLAFRNDAMLCCDLTETGAATKVRLLGRLEPKQQLTYQAVQTAGEVDAGALAAGGFDDATVGVTAWNNRLSALATKGLVTEYQHGRSKRYGAVLRNQ